MGGSLMTESWKPGPLAREEPLVIKGTLKPQPASRYSSTVHIPGKSDHRGPLVIAVDEVGFVVSGIALGELSS